MIGTRLALSPPTTLPSSQSHTLTHIDPLTCWAFEILRAAVKLKAKTWTSKALCRKREEIFYCSSLMPFHIDYQDIIITLQFSYFWSIFLLLVQVKSSWKTHFAAKSSFIDFSIIFLFSKSIFGRKWIFVALLLAECLNRRNQKVIAFYREFKLLLMQRLVESGSSPSFPIGVIFYSLLWNCFHKRDSEKLLFRFTSPVEWFAFPSCPNNPTPPVATCQQSPAAKRATFLQFCYCSLFFPSHSSLKLRMSFKAIVKAKIYWLLKVDLRWRQTIIFQIVFAVDTEHNAQSSP